MERWGSRPTSGGRVPGDLVSTWVHGSFKDLWGRWGSTPEDFGVKQREPTPEGSPRVIRSRPSGLEVWARPGVNMEVKGSLVNPVLSGSLTTKTPF